jgi:hypothetical protein
MLCNAWNGKGFVYIVKGRIFNIMFCVQCVHFREAKHIHMRHTRPIVGKVVIQGLISLGFSWKKTVVMILRRFEAKTNSLTVNRHS